MFSLIRYLFLGTIYVCIILYVYVIICIINMFLITIHIYIYILYTLGVAVRVIFQNGCLQGCNFSKARWTCSFWIMPAPSCPLKMKGLEQLKYYSVDRLKLHCGFERLAILAAETSEESFEGRLNTSVAEQIFSWFRSCSMVLNEVHDAQ